MKKLFRFALFFLVALSVPTMLSAEVSAVSPDFSVSALSAVVINADTGNIVYEKSALAQRAMASTTKIMTALLTIEAGDLDKKFTVDSYAIQVEGTSMG